MADRVGRARHRLVDVELESSSPEETERIAAGLASALRPGDLVTVAGELGAGKTTFVRGACRELGVDEPVTSPTYTVGHRYEGRVTVSHLDLYRFERSVSEDDWGDLEGTSRTQSCSSSGRSELSAISGKHAQRCGCSSSSPSVDSSGSKPQRNPWK